MTNHLEAVAYCLDGVEYFKENGDFTTFSELPTDKPSDLPPAKYVSIFGRSVPVPANLDMSHLIFIDSRGFPSVLFLTDPERTATMSFSRSTLGDPMVEIVHPYEDVFDLGYRITPDTVSRMDCIDDAYSASRLTVAMGYKSFHPGSSKSSVYRLDWGWLSTWQQWKGESDPRPRRWHARYIIDKREYFEIQWFLSESMKDFGWQTTVTPEAFDDTSVAAQVGRCLETMERECLDHIEGGTVRAAKL